MALPCPSFLARILNTIPPLYPHLIFKLLPSVPPSALDCNLRDGRLPSTANPAPKNTFLFLFISPCTRTGYGDSVISSLNIETIQRTPRTIASNTPIRELSSKNGRSRELDERFDSFESPSRYPRARSHRKRQSRDTNRKVCLLNTIAIALTTFAAAFDKCSSFWRKTGLPRPMTWGLQRNSSLSSRVLLSQMQCTSFPSYVGPRYLSGFATCMHLFECSTTTFR